MVETVLLGKLKARLTYVSLTHSAGLTALIMAILVMRIRLMWSILTLLCMRTLLGPAVSVSFARSFALSEFY